MLKKIPFYFFAISLIFPVMAKAQQKLTSVIVAPVVMQSFSDSIEALGTTKANESIVITPDVTEKIIGVHFEDGQLVKQGDLLITLDKSEEKASLSAARASLSEAQSSYKRAKGLQKNSALSKGTLEERLAALKQSEAMIEEIQARMNKRDILAPFEGVLGLRNVSIGSLVQPGDLITTLDDLSQIKVDFDVPAVFLSSLKQGIEVVGVIEAFGQREFKGQVSTVNTQVDPVTRTVKMRALVSNEDGVIKPGLLMKILLFKDERQTLIIPEEALVKRGTENFVFLIQNEGDKTTVKWTKVEIGTRKPGSLEILSGLKEKDQIVVHGTVKIRDGSEVKIRAVETENTPLDGLLKQSPTPRETP